MTVKLLTWCVVSGFFAVQVKKKKTLINLSCFMLKKKELSIFFFFFFVMVFSSLHCLSLQDLPELSEWVWSKVLFNVLKPARPSVYLNPTPLKPTEITSLLSQAWHVRRNCLSFPHAQLLKIGFDRIALYFQDFW